MSVANRLTDLQVQAQVSDMTILEIEITEASAEELLAPFRGSLRDAQRGAFAPHDFRGIVGLFSGMRVRVHKKSVLDRVTEALHTAAAKAQTSEAAEELRDLASELKNTFGARDEEELDGETE